MAGLNKQDMRRLAEALPHKDWYAGNAYGKKFIADYQVIAPTPEGNYVLLEGNQNFLDHAVANVAFVGACSPSAVLALLDENEELRDELGGLRNVSTETVKALKRLVMHARTTGGTAGPDAALMDACEQAEKMLSLGGIGRAYMEGADAVDLPETSHD